MSHSPSVDKSIDARYYLSSQGRMSRKHYLITISFILIIGIGLLAFISTLNSPALVIPVFLVTGYLTIVSGVKRLHDIGMSGLHMLWIIFFSILGVVGLCFASGEKGENRFGKSNNHL